MSEEDKVKPQAVPKKDETLKEFFENEIKAKPELYGPVSDIEAFINDPAFVKTHELEIYKKILADYEAEKKAGDDKASKGETPAEEKVEAKDASADQKEKEPEPAPIKDSRPLMVNPEETEEVTVTDVGIMASKPTSSPGESYFHPKFRTISLDEKSTIAYEHGLAFLKSSPLSQLLVYNDAFSIEKDDHRYAFLRVMMMYVPLIQFAKFTPQQFSTLDGTWIKDRALPSQYYDAVNNDTVSVNSFGGNGAYRAINFMDGSRRFKDFKETFVWASEKGFTPPNSPFVTMTERKGIIKEIVRRRNSSINLRKYLLQSLEEQLLDRDLVRIRDDSFFRALTLVREGMIDNIHEYSVDQYPRFYTQDLPAYIESVFAARLDNSATRFLGSQSAKLAQSMTGILIGNPELELGMGSPGMNLDGSTLDDINQISNIGAGVEFAKVYAEFLLSGRGKLLAPDFSSMRERTADVASLIALCVLGFVDHNLLDRRDLEELYVYLLRPFYTMDDMMVNGQNIQGAATLAASITQLGRIPILGMPTVLFTGSVNANPAGIIRQLQGILNDIVQVGGMRLRPLQMSAPFRNQNGVFYTPFPYAPGRIDDIVLGATPLTTTAFNALPNRIGNLVNRLAQVIDSKLPKGKGFLKKMQGQTMDSRYRRTATAFTSVFAKAPFAFGLQPFNPLESWANLPAASPANVVSFNPIGVVSLYLNGVTTTDIEDDVATLRLEKVTLPGNGPFVLMITASILKHMYMQLAADPGMIGRVLFTELQDTFMNAVLGVAKSYFDLPPDVVEFVKESIRDYDRYMANPVWRVTIPPLPAAFIEDLATLNTAPVPANGFRVFGTEVDGRVGAGNASERGELVPASPGTIPQGLQSNIYMLDHAALSREVREVYLPLDSFVLAGANNRETLNSSPDNTAEKSIIFALKRRPAANEVIELTELLDADRHDLRDADSPVMQLNTETIITMAKAHRRNVGGNFSYVRVPLQYGAKFSIEQLPPGRNIKLLEDSFVLDVKKKRTRLGVKFSVSGGKIPVYVKTLSLRDIAANGALQPDVINDTLRIGAMVPLDAIRFCMIGPALPSESNYENLYDNGTYLRNDLVFRGCNGVNYQEVALLATRTENTESKTTYPSRGRVLL